MVLRQARGQRCLVELAGPAVGREIFRPLHPVAARAIEFDAEHRLSAFVADDPRSIDEWRAMARVLAVAAVEIGHPVALFIAVKTQDRALHDETDPVDLASAGRTMIDGRGGPGALSRGARGTFHYQFECRS